MAQTINANQTPVIVAMQFNGSSGKTFTYPLCTGIFLAVFGMAIGLLIHRGHLRSSEQRQLDAGDEKGTGPFFGSE
jgi:hypothetical protein